MNLNEMKRKEDSIESHTETRNVTEIELRTVTASINQFSVVLTILQI